MPRLHPVGEETPKPASRTQALEGMPDEWIECRAVGHRDRIKKGYGVTIVDDRGRRVTYTAWAWIQRKCGRCGRVATSYYDQFFGALSGPAPVYPDGYLISGLGRGSPRREARREWLFRAVGEQPEDTQLVDVNTEP